MTPKGTLSARAALGQAGEAAAAEHLMQQGYTILERNLVIGDDEADIVALAPGGSVAVIEVKTRNGPWHPEDRIDSVKCSNLLRLAAALHQWPQFQERLFQFDVVAVSVDSSGNSTIHHWPHAFDAAGSPW